MYSVQISDATTSYVVRDLTYAQAIIRQRVALHCGYTARILN